MGKRHFEAACQQLKPIPHLKVEWKSFELDPSTARGRQGNLEEMLAAKYGKDLAWAKAMNDNVTAQARLAGLEFRLNLAKPANSFDAHRLIHLAQTSGLQNEMEESLFQAYFTQGRDISDHKVLGEIAETAGINPTRAKQALVSGEFSLEVRNDQKEAASLGISAVPFFVFNRRFAVSGAQPVEVFRRALFDASKTNSDGN